MKKKQIEAIMLKSIDRIRELENKFDVFRRMYLNLANVKQYGEDGIGLTSDEMDEVIKESSKPIVRWAVYRKAIDTIESISETREKVEWADKYDHLEIIKLVESKDEWYK